MSILAIPNNRQQQIVSVPKYSLKQRNWTIIFGTQVIKK